MILLMVGALLASNSVWTLPLVIAGAVMLVVAWIGNRLEGRFAVEWGQTGTQLALRATIRPAVRPVAEAPAQRTSASHEWVLNRASGADPGQIIDGEAHTVEIDVAELKALIAAAETAEAGVGPAEVSARDIRIRRMAHDAAHPASAASRAGRASPPVADA